MPMAAATSPPPRVDRRRGARLAIALAGATMLAAMLVVSVATRSTTSTRTPITGLPASPVMRATRVTGFQIGSP